MIQSGEASVAKDGAIVDDIGKLSSLSSQFTCSFVRREGNSLLTLLLVTLEPFRN